MRAVLICRSVKSFRRFSSCLPCIGRPNTNEMLQAILRQLTVVICYIYYVLMIIHLLLLFGATNKASFDERDIADKVLVPRTIADSHAEFCIPLSTDKDKRAEYLSSSGHVRLGKLLEDLDQLAVWVGLCHNRDETTSTDSGGWPNIGDVGSLPRTLVTAAVQRIDMHRKGLHPSRDIIIDGRVTWTGRSSLETSLRVFQMDEHNNLQQSMRANFIMVSRHPSLPMGVRVHSLVASEEEDAALISAGEEAMLERKGQKATSLLNSYPSSEEFRHLHSTFIESNRHRSDSLYNVTLNDHQVWLHDTRSEVKLICFPEHQNVYGKIFGGFLMRQALELAYLNAKMYCKGPLIILSVDDITFTRPVEVGDILLLTCLLTYSQGKYVQARVTAEVIRDKTFERNTSNVFHFTMEKADGKDVNEIVPQNYEHAILWLNGKRHMDSTLMKLPYE